MKRMKHKIEKTVMGVRVAVEIEEDVSQWTRWARRWPRPSAAGDFTRRFAEGDVIEVDRGHQRGAAAVVGGPGAGT